MLARMTKLNAINRMLRAAEQPPVSTLVNTGVNDVSTAETILEEVSRMVLSEGWADTISFETLHPDTNGFIYVPETVLWLEPVEEQYYSGIVRKDNRLFDVKNNTFVFTESIKLKVVYFVPFEDLTPVLQMYIADLAAQEYQVHELGDLNKDAILNRHTIMSKAKAVAADVKSRNRRFSDSPYGNVMKTKLRHQGWSVYRNKGGYNL